jgi:GxxExxY protein
MSKLLGEELTHAVIGAFFEVYNTLKYGFLESIYLGALAHELGLRGLVVEREAGVPVWYKGADVGLQRLDMLVNKSLVLELKSSPNLNKEAPRQLLSYLRATRLEVGLLLHFSPSGARFYRVVNSINRDKSA